MSKQYQKAMRNLLNLSTSFCPKKMLIVDLFIFLDPIGNFPSQMKEKIWFQIRRKTNLFS